MNAARKAARSAITFRFLAGSALAAALLAGCASASNADRVASASAKAEQFSARDAERNVSKVEKSVELQPSDAVLRVSLGQAYMKAGRFESAITAFNDAIELGDENPRTALSLALANIAIGRNDEAVAVLDDWRSELNPVDSGLAYALAGQTRRGAGMLADAVRGGADTIQARQNFAYALALDGRWREARIMMSQDLSPDVINNRIGEWAELASVGNPRVNIAVLLGAPVRVDAGQPERLALAVPAQVQPAVETATEVPAEPQESRPAPNASFAEAAPVAAPPMLAAAAPAPVEAPVAVASPQFEAAFAKAGYVSVPVIQQIPASVAKAPRVASSRPAPAKAQSKPAASWPVAANGTHVVQLGSFTSEESARRAWGVYTSRNASLRNYRLTIIPATVNGKNYYRVAAAGFDAGTARNMCGSIKARGGSCLAYANTRAPEDRGGPQMARRR